MRIEPAPVDSALPAFAVARKRYGWLPMTIRVMARGATVADQYLDAGIRNGNGSITALDRELIAVAVASENDCAYCRTAHTLAAFALGAQPEPSRPGSVAVPADPHTRALVDFARRVLLTHGKLTDDEVSEARDAGLDDSTMIDVVAVVAENILGNLINNLAQTELDSALTKAADRLEAMA